MKKVNTAPKKDPKGNTNILTISKEEILTSRQISDNRLIEGGAEIFEQHNKNINKVNVDIKANTPLLRYILRLCNRSYIILTAQNNPDDPNPCLIIIINLPLNPHPVPVRIPPITNPI